MRITIETWTEQNVKQRRETGGRFTEDVESLAGRNPLKDRNRCLFRYVRTPPSVASLTSNLGRIEAFAEERLVVDTSGGSHMAGRLSQKGDDEKALVLQVRNRDPTGWSAVRPALQGAQSGPHAVNIPDLEIESAEDQNGCCWGNHQLCHRMGLSHPRKVSEQVPLKPRKHESQQADNGKTSSRSRKRKRKSTSDQPGSPKRKIAKVREKTPVLESTKLIPLSRSPRKLHAELLFANQLSSAFSYNAKLEKRTRKESSTPELQRRKTITKFFAIEEEQGNGDNHREANEHSQESSLMADPSLQMINDVPLETQVDMEASMDPPESPQLLPPQEDFFSFNPIATNINIHESRAGNDGNRPKTAKSLAQRACPDEKGMEHANDKKQKSYKRPRRSIPVVAHRNPLDKQSASTSILHHANLDSSAGAGPETRMAKSSSAIDGSRRKHKSAKLGRTLSLPLDWPTRAIHPYGSDTSRIKTSIEIVVPTLPGAIRRTTIGIDAVAIRNQFPGVSPQLDRDLQSGKERPISHVDGPCQGDAEMETAETSNTALASNVAKNKLTSPAKTDASLILPEQTAKRKRSKKLANVGGVAESEDSDRIPAKDAAITRESPPFLAEKQDNISPEASTTFASPSDIAITVKCISGVNGQIGDSASVVPAGDGRHRRPNAARQQKPVRAKTPPLSQTQTRAKTPPLSQNQTKMKTPPLPQNQTRAKTLPLPQNQTRAKTPSISQNQTRAKTPPLSQSQSGTPFVHVSSTPRKHKAHKSSSSPLAPFFGAGRDEFNSTGFVSLHNRRRRSAVTDGAAVEDDVPTKPLEVNPPLIERLSAGPLTGIHGKSAQKPRKAESAYIKLLRSREVVLPVPKPKDQPITEDNASVGHEKNTAINHSTPRTTMHGPTTPSASANARYKIDSTATLPTDKLLKSNGSTFRTETPSRGSLTEFRDENHFPATASDPGGAVDGGPHHPTVAPVSRGMPLTGYLMNDRSPVLMACSSVNNPPDDTVNIVAAPDLISSVVTESSAAYQSSIASAASAKLHRHQAVSSPFRSDKTPIAKLHREMATPTTSGHIHRQRNVFDFQDDDIEDTTYHSHTNEDGKTTYPPSEVRTRRKLKRTVLAPSETSSILSKQILQHFQQTTAPPPDLQLPSAPQTSDQAQRFHAADVNPPLIRSNSDGNLVPGTIARQDSLTFLLGENSAVKSQSSSSPGKSQTMPSFDADANMLEIAEFLADDVNLYKNLS